MQSLPRHSSAGIVETARSPGLLNVDVRLIGIGSDLKGDREGAWCPRCNFVPAVAHFSTPLICLLQRAPPR